MRRYSTNPPSAILKLQKAFIDAGGTFEEFVMLLLRYQGREWCADQLRQLQQLTPEQVSAVKAGRMCLEFREGRYKCLPLRGCAKKHVQLLDAFNHGDGLPS